MQTLATISKRCKSGKTSTWRFAQTPDGLFFAIGGVDKELKQFPTLEQMRNCYRNYLKYGYTLVADVEQLQLAF